MRVVVVEDDLRLRSVLAVFFRSIGADVLAAPADGLEALELLESLHPDLIVTDCQMPRLDGISLVRRLRARGDRTPIIMLSGQTEPTIRNLALSAGANQYLTKPLNAGALNIAIVQTLRGTAA